MNPHFFFSGLIGAWFCMMALSGHGASAQIAVTGDAVPQLKPFDDMLTKFLTEHGAPGAAVAVGRGGKVIYSRGFGLADREKDEKVQPGALFRIASISKPITAVAILQLVERGKLKLDDKPFELLAVKAHLENGKGPDPRLRQITIAQLLHHTGGYDRAKSYDPMFRSRAIARALVKLAPAMPDDVIRYMAGQPLDFEPGTRYAYSNFGYCVLGRVIEKVSGKNYEEYVKSEVLKPVGVTGMRLGRTLPKHRAAGEVRYHERTPGEGTVVFDTPGQISIPIPKVSNPYGAWCLEAMDAHGGWLASAPDLVRFAMAFDSPADCPILKAESIRTMFAAPLLPAEAVSSNEKTPDGKPAVHYGCGWNVRYVGDSKDGRVNTWHLGGLAGTSTLLVRRHDGLTWAVLFNSDFAADKQWLASKVDPLMHQAAAQVKRWP